MTTHDEIQEIIARLTVMRERHRLPYANDLWWRLGDAISQLERADEATSEVRYADYETQEGATET